MSGSFLWLIALIAFVFIVAVIPLISSIYDYIVADSYTNGTIIQTNYVFKGLGSVQFKYLVNNKWYIIKDTKIGGYINNQQVKIKYFSKKPIHAYIDNLYYLVIMYKIFIAIIMTVIAIMVIRLNENIVPPKIEKKIVDISDDAEKREMEKRNKFMNW